MIASLAIQATMADHNLNETKRDDTSECAGAESCRLIEIWLFFMHALQPSPSLGGVEANERSHDVTNP